jgi:large subunit ribosomal protein L25
MANAAVNNSLEATSREATSKNAARRVRVAGQVPAVVYGAGKNSQTVSVDPRQVKRILYSETGHNTIVDLKLPGELTKAMIVDWQFEPIKGALLHVDFKRIAMDKVLRVNVPILLKGEAAGVKLEGGILEQILREVEIECLPADIPGHIDVDVSGLAFGEMIRVADLPHGEKLKFLTDSNQMVAHVIAIKEVVEATPDAVAADVAAGAVEPEVAKKGKQDAEEGADAAADKGKEGDKKKDKK